MSPSPLPENSQGRTTRETSPLDEYFRNEDLVGSLRPFVDGLPTTASLASEMSLLPSPPLDQPVAGPSKLIKLPSPPAMVDPQALAIRSAAFAEEFKYLVCSSGVLERSYVPGLSGRAAELARVKRRRRDMAREVLQTGRDMAKERKDVTAAALVLIVALGTAVYQWRALGWSLGVVFVVVLAASRKRRPPPPRPPADPPDRALTAVTAFLSASRALDVTTDAAFALLAPSPDSIETHHALRAVLHQLTTSMTDALATATSELLALVDRAELAVLGEMYDIPVAGSFIYARRTPRRDVSEDTAGVPAPTMLATPARPVMLHRPSSDVPAPVRPALVPMTPPYNSYPGRMRSAHASQSSIHSSPIFDIDDRFTKVPPRTPRLSKRSSWSSDWYAPSSVRPAHERRITEADEEEHGDADISVTSAGTTSLSCASKRRSLLGMPYYASDASDAPISAEAVDLSRTKSLPISNLQHLRTLSATGAPRHPSIALAVDAAAAAQPPMAIGLGFPFGRRSRVESVSPLTVAGLKASYLGVHLKRRRMACCLLGLEFADLTAGQYWTDVADALDTLTTAITDSVAGVDAARAHAEREADAARLLADLAAHTAVAPGAEPFASAAIIPGGVDFAPRDSDDAKLLAHISGIQAGLARIWAVTEAAKEAAVGGGDIVPRWSDMKQELSLIVREVERGREIAGRLGAAQETQATGTADEAVADILPAPTPSRDLPDFVKAWDAPRTVIGFDSVETTIEQPLAEAEALPPPGRDEVYEATISALDRRSALAGLPRDERIRLAKEARAEGVTVAELVERDAARPRRDDMRRQEGQVVSELKGMMDMIRQRKGVGEARSDAGEAGRAGRGSNGAGDVNPAVDRPGAFPQPALGLKVGLPVLEPDADELVPRRADPGAGAKHAEPRLDVRIADVRRAFVFPPPVAR
ncbi:hypothetical protein Q5752_007045 [Cryptotrichosporon argae]